MTTSIKQHIFELLAQDVEELQLSATSEAPTRQAELVNEGIWILEKNEIPEDKAIKLLRLIQAVLAGRYVLFVEDDLVRKLHWTLHFRKTQGAPEIRETACDIAALLLNRMRQARANLPRATLNLLRSAMRHAESAHQKLALGGIIERIKNAEERISKSLTSKSVKFKIPDLDIQLAATNVQEDAIRDWYQDPWGWPELEWLGKTHPHKVAERLRGGDSDWTVPVDVAKPAGGVRPGMVINPLDRLAYQSLADELSIEATGSLPNWVYGWRLSRTSARKGNYESNNAEWRTFRTRVTKLCEDFKFAARVDIESFFASANTSTLLAQIGRRYRTTGVIDRLEHYFQHWQNQANGRGIPQRALASSVLAHVLLQSVDAYLNRITAGGSSKRLVASRWMDDIWLHCDSEKLLKECVSEIEGMVSHSGLSINAQKTRVFPGEKARKEVQIVATYGDPDSDPEPTPPLEDLLNDLEDSPPSLVNWEIGKMIRRRNFSALTAISAERFSHFSFLGDRLAAAFRISGEWRRLSEPYLEFAREQVTNENHSVVAWGEMFPNQSGRELKKVYNAFVLHLSDPSRRLLTPLAAQRLVSWSDDKTGSSFDSIALSEIEGQNDVFRLRGLTFAALKRPKVRNHIKEIINQLGDTLIAQFIRDNGYTPPTLSKRFQLE